MLDQAISAPDVCVCMCLIRFHALVVDKTIPFLLNFCYLCIIILIQTQLLWSRGHPGISFSQSASHKQTLSQLWHILTAVPSNGVSVARPLSERSRTVSTK